MRVSRLDFLVILLLLAMTFGCEGGADDDIPLYPVPLTRGLQSAPAPGAARPLQPFPARPVGQTTQATQSPVTWTVPNGWVQEAPSSSMRLAQWRLDDGVVCAVSSFGGGGSVDANLNRWVGQFQQPDGSASNDAAVVQRGEFNGLSVTTLQLDGTYISRNPPMTGPEERHANWALFSAIAEVGADDKTFLKCVGPQAAMASSRDSIDRFVSSLTVR
jgi:hypothetical protein